MIEQTIIIRTYYKTTFLSPKRGEEDFQNSKVTCDGESFRIAIPRCAVQNNKIRETDLYIRDRVQSEIPAKCVGRRLAQS